jgi:peptide/nickel transport system permease protein
MQFHSSGSRSNSRSRLRGSLVFFALVAVFLLGALPAGARAPSGAAATSGLPSPTHTAAYANPDTPDFTVSGLVENLSGEPVANASVQGLYPSFPPAVSNDTGQFSTTLPRGSYQIFVGASDYYYLYANLTVSSPTTGLVYVLTPVVTYPITGQVVDGWSGNGIPHALVEVTELNPAFSYSASVYSGDDGSFRIPGPNGTLQVSVVPAAGYSPVSASISVVGAPIHDLRLSLPPLGVGQSNLDPYSVVLVSIPIVLGVLAVARFLEARRRRVAQGLPPGVFSRFTRRIVMRAALIPFQLAAILTILYVFGQFLVEVGRGTTPCDFAGVSCGGGSCTWASLTCTVEAFWFGYSQFLVNIFTLNLGTASYGAFSAPAVQFLAWWAPNSLELAVFALGIAFLLAYPLGLLAGWKSGSGFDAGARVASMVALLVPTFLLISLLLATYFVPFSQMFGDTPYGFLPSSIWFEAHYGGAPSVPWIGPGYNTTPTGFPLIDGAIRGQWAFEVVVLAKTVFQGTAIALIYLAIFLRYARQAVVTAARETHVQAARARGVTESTLLWRHTGRRVLPLYVLLFAVTLPIYLGTQALVEAIFADPGLGTLFIINLTGLPSTSIGFLMQVFLIAILVLVASLAAEVLSWRLDPRLGPTGY